MNSNKYSLNKADLKKIGTTVLFSVGSAVASTLIVVMADMNFGSYAFLIPLINTGLYSAKKFFEGRAI